MATPAFKATVNDHYKGHYGVEITFEAPIDGTDYFAFLESACSTLKEYVDCRHIGEYAVYSEGVYSVDVCLFVPEAELDNLRTLGAVEFSDSFVDHDLGADILG
jgi:hypothetical protein